MYITSFHWLRRCADIMKIYHIHHIATFTLKHKISLLHFAIFSSLLPLQRQVRCQLSADEHMRLWFLIKYLRHTRMTLYEYDLLRQVMWFTIMQFHYLMICRLFRDISHNIAAYAPKFHTTRYFSFGVYAMIDFVLPLAYRIPANTAHR